MVSRRKGHSETWAPFSPHVSNEPLFANTIAFNSRKRAPWNPPAPPSRSERSPRKRRRRRRTRRRQAGEGKSSSKARRGLPLRLLFIIIIIHSSSSTSHPDGSSAAAVCAMGTYEIARSFDSCRSLARRASAFSATRKGHRKRARASSGKKTRVTGAYSYEGRSAEVTRLGSSLSPLTFASFNVANDARLSSLILRVALRRDNHMRSGE